MDRIEIDTEVLGLLNTMHIVESGLKDVTYNFRKAYSDYHILPALAAEMTKIIPANATCIAASGNGGIPLATFIMQRRRIPLTLVRPAIKGQKGFNPLKMIDGYTPTPKDIVVIVDDVLPSAEDSIRIVNYTLSKLDTTVECACVLLRRTDVLVRAAIPVRSLYRIEHFQNGGHLRDLP
jgi:orotate phosphoribosyltransferase